MGGRTQGALRYAARTGSLLTTGKNMATEVVSEKLHKRYGRKASGEMPEGQLWVRLALQPVFTMESECRMTCKLLHANEVGDARAVFCA